MGNGDEILGVAEILKRWEIQDPLQVIDILGLWGDASDNIPGVPGVGEKTAKKLIQEFGSMEAILENTDKLKGKLQENMRLHVEQAKISKWLATIDTQVPVELDIKGLELEPVNEPVLREVFEELEFRTLMRRVLGESGSDANSGSTSSNSGAESAPAANLGTDLFGNPMRASAPKKVKPTNPNQTSLFGAETASPSDDTSDDAAELEEEVTYKTILDVSHRYRIANSAETIAELLKELENSEAFCFDTETTDVESLHASLVGLSFSTASFTGWYVPVPEDRLQAMSVLEQFRSILGSSKLKIAQNIKYDISVMENYGVSVALPMFDTMLAHYLLEPDQRHNMQLLSEKFLQYSPIPIETLIGKKGKGQGSMKDVELEVIAEYATEDADITFQLFEVLQPALVEKGLLGLLMDVEMPLVLVLEAMERQGVKVDIDFLKEYSNQLLGQVRTVQAAIFSDAGNVFNIASAQQVGKILFEQLKLSDKPKKTKTGQYQTDEETLNSLLGKHPIVQNILDFRALQKLKSTYVDALPLLVDVNTGRVHTHFNQAVAATGRLSSQNPNLQNIPIRTELGREIRKAFVSKGADTTLLSLDYSQIELRIIAHISGDPGMQEAFQQGIDIHTATAAKVWGVAIEDVDKEMRRKAKTVNFGIIYGISAFGLSQRVGISRGEAKEIIENYFKQFGGVKTYMDETVNKARENGYVETILGRRRYMRDINSANAVMRGFAERNAINAPIQGSAADMIKVAMIQIHNWLNDEKLKTRMILQVHDELLFDVPNDELELVEAKIKYLMENSMPLSIPVVVESGTGNNWLEAH
jgi:DNA polymerase-1